MKKLADVIDLARIRQQKRAVEDPPDDPSWHRVQNLDFSGVAITVADRGRIARGELKETRFTDAIATWSTMTDRPILVLSSTVGRGKTVAAASALAEQRGRYVSAFDAARLFSSNYSEDADAVDRLIATPLLVLDDVGTEGDRERMASALIRIVEGRRDRGKRTIITTNISRADFKARYPDPRLHSRLDQSSVYVSDKGDDMRAG